MVQKTGRDLIVGAQREDRSEILRRVYHGHFPWDSVLSAREWHFSSDLLSDWRRRHRTPLRRLNGSEAFSKLAKVCSRRVLLECPRLTCVQITFKTRQKVRNRACTGLARRD